MTTRAMRVEGEEPFSFRLERFGVRHSGTFLQRVHGICGYVLLGGTRWSGPKARDPGSPGSRVTWPAPKSNSF
jgi:hypothetical protein